MFINCVLGVNAKHRGLYGKTKAYYGTVEQQGRLTLHLHILLWLMGNLTPQEMRNKILDPNSEFQKKIITWIESCQVGEFFTGTQQEVLTNVQKYLVENSDYKDPTETMPTPPPEICQKAHVSIDDCMACLNTKNGGQNLNKLLMILSANLIFIAVKEEQTKMAQESII